MSAAATALGSDFWRTILAGPVTRNSDGPYGALLDPDANGLMLPPGFTSRVVARSTEPVGGTDYVLPIFPDGAATFPTPDGGWILVVNTENSVEGGASAIRFAADGTVTDAYRVLEGTSTNCAGGATPWGTWLSCEEVDDGQVWECDPTGATTAVVRPALGTFNHEAVCVDPVREQLYLSEDETGGGLYRFTPETYPDLSSGVLEVACDAGDGAVEWRRVPDPAAANPPTRSQVAGTIPFARGEGIWFDSGVVYLATTSDDTIHAYDTATSALSVLYRADDVDDPPLRGVDNLHATRAGDLFVAEDSYDDDPDAMDVCLITPAREVSRFLKMTGREHFMPDAQSETVGVCFDPSGRRMYIGSQRWDGNGIIYEITGPFRQPPLASQDPLAGARLPAAPIGIAAAQRVSVDQLRGAGVVVALTLDAAASGELLLEAGGRTVATIAHDFARGTQSLALRAPDAAPGDGVLELRLDGQSAARRAILIEP